MPGYREQGPRHDMTTQFRESLRAMGLAPAEALGNILEQQCSSGARLFSLAQWMEEPSLLQQQLLTETPHGSDRLLSRARNSVLVQDFALNIIGPLTLRLFKDGEVSIPSPAEIFF